MERLKKLFPQQVTLVSAETGMKDRGFPGVSATTRTKEGFEDQQKLLTHKNTSQTHFKFFSIPGLNSVLPSAMHQSTMPDAEKDATTTTTPDQDDFNKEDFQVQFQDGDKENPKNFHTSYKIWLTGQMSMLAFVGSLGSSIMSPAQAEIATYLGVGHEVTVLTLSLFVLGKNPQKS